MYSVSDDFWRVVGVVLDFENFDERENFLVFSEFFKFYTFHTHR